MKNIISLLLIAAALNCSGQTAQTLQTVKTYFDPYTKTKLKEVYTVLPNTPTKQGTYKVYDEDGALVTQSSFINGKLNGVMKHYYTTDAEKGKVGSIETYKEDELDGISEEYRYIKGVKVTVKSQTYKDGKLVKWLVYYDNGKIQSYMVPNGVVYELYGNGQKRLEGTAKDGKGNGEFTMWYEDGKVKQKGTYIDDSKVGVWIDYYENGDTMNIAEYDNNSNVIDERAYMEDGTVLKVVNGKYIDVQYYPSGKVKSETTKTLIDVTNPSWGKTGKQFINQGLYVEYYEDGRKKVEGYYGGGSQNGSWTYYAEDGTRSFRNF